MVYKIRRDTFKCLATHKDVTSMMKKDAVRVYGVGPKDVESWCDLNRAGYTVAVNTWVACVSEYSQYAASAVMYQLVERGLYDTIARCAKAADQFLASGGELHSVTDTFCIALYNDITRDIRIPWGQNTRSDAGLVGIDEEVTWLFLMRYLKRFAPINCPELAKSAISAFLAANNACKLKSRHEISPVIIDGVREWLNKLPWTKITREISKISEKDIVPMPGTSFEGCVTEYDKWDAMYGTEDPDLFVPKPIACFGRNNFHYCERFKTAPKGVIHPVRVIAVPKNYKSYRIVAPEPVYLGAYTKAVFRIMERYLPEGIYLREQWRSQWLAQVGAMCDGVLATVDLTAASDNHCKALLYSVLPAEMLPILDKILPSHAFVNGRWHLLHMVGTMGNPVTFILMSLVLWAICHAAYDFWSRWVRRDGGKAPRNPQIIVYGDDIGALAAYYGTLTEWLEKCGFVINRDKSFADEGEGIHFRESCGMEFLGRKCVTHAYFPRHPLQGLAIDQKGKFCIKNPKTYATYDAGSDTRVLEDATASLLSIQHELFGISHLASEYVASVIADLHPKMTRSAGQHRDVWSYGESESRVKEAPWNTIEYEYVMGSMTHPKVHLAKRKEDKPASVPERAYRYGYRVDYNQNLSAISGEWKDNYEQILYTHYLLFGPEYSDPLSELLHVSVPRRNPKRAFSKPTFKWGLIEDDEG